MSAPRRSAAVIGAGFGGIALAIRLQSAGVQTTLFEARDKPGGRAYVYHDQGFTFDAGPTVITDPSALEELFALSGRCLADYVELLPVAPFYRLCWEDGSYFDYANDQTEIDRQIHALSPVDVEGYQRFLAYSKDVFDEGYIKLGTVPFLSFRSMVQAAPQLLSFLGEASLKHLETVQRLLTACDVPWTVNPRLVRGLDYYSHTVFEFITTELGAQGTLCGGGRYDGLFEVLGGKPTPAVGWGMGIERVLELLKEQSIEASDTVLDAYAIVPDLADAALVAPLLQKLRDQGVSVQMHATADGTAGAMKSQFKKADASGARYALVFGAEELAKQQVAVKSLRDGQGAQTLQSLQSVESWAKTLKV